MVTCANCGKTGLKRTYEVMLDGSVQRVGSECAKHFKRASAADAVHDMVSSESVIRLINSQEPLSEAAMQEFARNSAWEVRSALALSRRRLSDSVLKRLADDKDSRVRLAVWWPYGEPPA